jgi:hypothetical protein
VGPLRRRLANSGPHRKDSKDPRDSKDFKDEESVLEVLEVLGVLVIAKRAGAVLTTARYQM